MVSVCLPREAGQGNDDYPRKDERPSWPRLLEAVCNLGKHGKIRFRTGFFAAPASDERKAGGGPGQADAKHAHTVCSRSMAAGEMRSRPSDGSNTASTRQPAASAARAR